MKLFNMLCVVLVVCLHPSIQAQPLQTKQIDSLVAKTMATMPQAGIAVAVVKDGKVVHVKGYGVTSVKTNAIGLPDLDGFELRNQARSVCPQLPVFLITGRHEIADQSRAQGISGFFRKPFDGRILLAALQEALRAAEKGRGS